MNEYITKGDDYANWLQWATVEESKKFKGVSIIMFVLNPVHLDHANMQQVVMYGDERWDEIRSAIKFDHALSKNHAKELWTMLEDF